VVGFRTNPRRNLPNNAWHGLQILAPPMNFTTLGNETKPLSVSLHLVGPPSISFTTVVSGHPPFTNRTCFLPDRYHSHSFSRCPFTHPLTDPRPYIHTQLIGQNRRSLFFKNEHHTRCRIPSESERVRATCLPRNIGSMVPSISVNT